MEPIAISNTRIVAVKSYLLNSGTDSYGTHTSGLNERIEEALRKCSDDGFTELVDVRYAVASDAEGDATHGALLVVRRR